MCQCKTWFTNRALGVYSGFRKQHPLQVSHTFKLHFLEDPSGHLSTSGQHFIKKKSPFSSLKMFLRKGNRWVLINSGYIIFFNFDIKAKNMPVQFQTIFYRETVE